MRDTEAIPLRAIRGHTSYSQDWKALSELHALGPARVVRPGKLKMHLVIDHGISVKDVKTPGDMGKLHLLAHACQAYPELRELLGIDELWGKG